MVYYKTTDDNGFVSVSTLNAEAGGNCTKEEHDEIAAMYREAERGYGVIETASGFAFALRPVPPAETGDEEATASDYEAALEELGVVLDDAG